MDETAVVRALRAAFRWWPYMHGRGWLLRLARLLLGRKVDVGGAEVLVFRGARDLLSSQRAPIVFVELDEKLCAPFGATPREVRGFLVDRGYAMYRWRDSAFSPVGPDERHGPEDIFALKAVP